MFNQQTGAGGGGNPLQQWMTRGAADPYSRRMEDELAQQREREAGARSDLERYYQQAGQYGEPYLKGGGEAWQAYLGSMGMGGPGAYQSALSRFKLSPGYQTALRQGQQSLQSGAAATGTLQSGAEQKALSRYGQQMAEGEFGKWQAGLGQAAGVGQRFAEEAAQRAMGMGGQEVGLGEHYGDIEARMREEEAQAEEERRLMEEYERSQRRSGLWGALGKIGGMVGGQVVRHFLP